MVISDKSKKFILANATDFIIILLIAFGVILQRSYNSNFLLYTSFMILCIFTSIVIFDMVKQKTIFTKYMVEYINKELERKYLFLVRNSLLYFIYYYLFLISDFYLGVAIVSVLALVDLVIISGLFSKNILNKINKNKVI